MITRYECDKCWTLASVRHAKDAGAWEVAEKILEDHDRRWPKCKAGFDEIRCWLPRQSAHISTAA